MKATILLAEDEQAMREVLPAQDYTPLDAALPQGVTEAYRAGDAWKTQFD